jgi:hypothetical protein
MWKEAVVAKCEVAATHLREWTKEDNEIRDGSGI